MDVPRTVSGEVLRGGCDDVGEGVLARGDTGTCVDDFLLGEWFVRNLGINPCNDAVTQNKYHHQDHRYESTCPQNQDIQTHDSARAPF